MVKHQHTTTIETQPKGYSGLRGPLYPLLNRLCFSALFYFSGPAGRHTMDCSPIGSQAWKAGIPAAEVDRPSSAIKARNFSNLLETCEAKTLALVRGARAHQYDNYSC